VLDDAGAWLCEHGPAAALANEGCPPETPTPESRQELLRDAWEGLALTCLRFAHSPNAPLRNGAMMSLQKFFALAEGTNMAPVVWLRVLAADGGLLGCMEGLLSLSGRTAIYPDIAKTLQLGILALSRALLQEGVDVAQVWQQALTVLESCMSLETNDLATTVPDVLRNMLLVLSQRKVLRETWRDSGKRDLWRITWRMSRAISPSLTPEVLLGQRTNGLE
jgi:hypothetical protein